MTQFDSRRAQNVLWPMRITASGQDRQGTVRAAYFSENAVSTYKTTRCHSA